MTHVAPGATHNDSAAAFHAALFYEGDEHYIRSVCDFLAVGLEAGEPVAIAVPGDRAALLQQELGPSGPDLTVLDMVELGRNPARIIPAVLAMLESHQGRTLHYVGEPIWPGRSIEEIQEATRHEALINLAWPDAPIRVLCPYDARQLDPAVLRDAECTHPWLLRGAETVTSERYDGSSLPAGTDDPFARPPAPAARLHFELQDLGAVRHLVRTAASGAGVDRARTEDLVLAVSEVVTNAVKHAAGDGVLSVWSEPTALICQIEDSGHIADPLAGRRAPRASVEGGIGLWMVNQLVDLAEVRTTPSGTTIRLRTRRG